MHAVGVPMQLNMRVGTRRPTLICFQTVVTLAVIVFAAHCSSRLSEGQQLDPVRAPSGKTLQTQMPESQIHGTQGPVTSDSPIMGPSRDIPQLVDITHSTNIHFDHLSSPESKYIVESMSGGVALIDFDRDGWPDIYFTNAPSVDMVLAGKKARSALYRNNHDGTFTDVTEEAGIGYPCWAMGASVGDYNNDGWPDLLVTCFGGVVLFRNNGDGTFSDVTAKAGLDKDAGWATGAAFGDYDGDGWADLFVAHYVDLDLKDLPAFGSKVTCQYHAIPVQCGPRGLKGSPDNLYHNNGDGTFSEVSKQAGVDDQKRLYGMAAVWCDFNNDGRLDLFVANDGQPNYLYRNDGNVHFTDVALQAGVGVNLDGSEQANMGVALADYQRKAISAMTCCGVERYMNCCGGN